MKNLTKDEFRTYCLLFAANADFNITKQEIIAIGAKIDPEDFVRVYNWFEADSDIERVETIQANKTQYIKRQRWTIKKIHSALLKSFRLQYFRYFYP